MVKIFRSGGTVFIAPSDDISITMHYETAISLRDQLNDMFPAEPCATAITKEKRGT